MTQRFLVWETWANGGAINQEIKYRQRNRCRKQGGWLPCLQEPLSRVVPCIQQVFTKCLLFFSTSVASPAIRLFDIHHKVCVYLVSHPRAYTCVSMTLLHPGFSRLQLYFRSCPLPHRASVSFLGLYSLSPFLYLNALLSVNMRGLFSALSSNITCLDKNTFLTSWTRDYLPAPNPPRYSAVRNTVGAGAGTQLATFLFFLCQLASCQVQQQAALDYRELGKQRVGRKDLCSFRIVF